MTSASDSYAAFEDLKDIYLEDSWVLTVDAAECTVAFALDAVLTPDHRGYAAPEPGQQYCYRTATLVLSSDTPIAYDMRGQRPHLDPDGSTDLGNIDTFDPIGRGSWRLTGDWGRITIAHPRVTLTMAVAP
jgi:hypothetical protein